MIKYFKDNSFFKKNSGIILILIVAFILRFYHLDFQSVWLDEIYTLNISNPNLSFSEFHKELIKREGFPHLYFLLLKLLYFFFGYSPLVARSLSVIAGVLAVWAIYSLAKKLHNKKIALYSAILLAVSEYNIFISQDARPYTLYLLFSILSFYFLVKFIKNDGWKNAFYYGLITGVLLNFNFFGFINVFSQCTIILFFLFSKEKNEKILFFKKSIVSGIIALILFLPAVEKLIVLLNYKSFWVPGPQKDSYEIIFDNILGNNEIINFIVWALLVYFVINIFNEKNQFQYNFNTLIKQKRFFSFIILSFWFITLLSFLIVSSYGKTSYLLTRYFTSIIPVVFIVISVSVSKIPNALYRNLVLILLVFFNLVNLFFDKKHYTKIHNPQFREVAQFVLTKNKDNIPAYSTQKYWFDYFINSSKSKVKITQKNINDVVAEMEKNPSSKKDFWIFGAFKDEFKPLPKTQEFLNKNFYIEEQFDGYKAWAKHFVIKKKKAKEIFITNLNVLLKNNPTNVFFQIEKNYQTKRFLNIKGFAYLRNQDAITTKIDLIAVKDTVAYRLESNQFLRADIQRIEEKYDIENCGFKLNQDLYNLKKGTYLIGIYLHDVRTNKKAIIKIDTIKR